MITAELSYRDYMGAWNIATKFAKIKFSGNEDIVQLLTKLERLIRFEQYDKQKAKIKCLKEFKEQNNSEIEILKFEINSLKKKHKLVILHKEVYSEIKCLNKEIERLSWLNQNIQYAINNLDDDLFFDVHKLKSKYKNMLAKLDFSSKNSYHQSHNDISVQIYEYNGDEELLAEKVKSITAKLQTKLDNEIAQIKQRTEAKLKSKDITPLEILEL